MMATFRTSPRTVLSALMRSFPGDVQVESLAWLAGGKKREKGVSPSHVTILYLVMTKEATKYATSKVPCTPPPQRIIILAGQLQQLARKGSKQAKCRGRRMRSGPVKGA